MYTDTKPTLDFMLKFYSLVPETDPLDLVKCVNHNTHCLQAVLSHPKWETLNFINLYEIIDREIICWALQSGASQKTRNPAGCFENILRLMKLVPNISLFRKSLIPVNGEWLIKAKSTKEQLLDIEYDRRRNLKCIEMKVTSHTYPVNFLQTFLNPLCQN